MPGNALIGGSEKSEELVFPPDWPCVCGHDLKCHMVGERILGCRLSPKGEIVTALQAYSTTMGFVDNCYKFEPVDNLTYVELLAETKKV